MKGFSFKEVTRKEIKDFIETNHYSKNINGLKISFCFALYSVSGEIIGACLFGGLSTTSWKRYGDTERDVIELRRLVLVDEAPKNTESWFISKCLSHIKQKSSYKVVVSYADPYHGHIGYVYQASNFIYLGQTNKDKLLKDIVTGKLYHSRALRTKYKGDYKPFVKILREKQSQGLLEEVIVPGKHVYVYPLRKTNRKRFLNISKEYPKENE